MLRFEGQPPKPCSELLNLSYPELAQLTVGISDDRSKLAEYLAVMRDAHPGLAKQAGVWVGLYRNMIPAHGVSKALRAEGAFTAGNLMMYELLRRGAESTGRAFPNPEFDSDNVVDTEISEEEVEWLIDASMRGVKLHQDHPQFFDLALELFRHKYKHYSLAELKHRLFNAPDWNDAEMFDLVNYLAGAAETVLPIERQAQVDLLRRDL